MANIAIDRVSKAYGPTTVLDQVSVAVAEGEFVVLVGPSGCGKSTLLRSVAGLEPIDSGEIRIGDKVVNHLPPSERDIAMVFQNYALYPHMSVAQNMAFALKLRGFKKADILERVARSADILGLAALLGRRPRELSGGQRQRVAMGRAMVRDPMVFLFDEPLSNLDAKLRVHMRLEIRELHYRLEATSIYVTHDQIEAMTMADRIVVMRDGIVEQTGEPLELYDRPRNTFVAGFLGSPAMNFIAGRLDPGAAPAFVTDAGLRMPLGVLPAGSSPGPVTLGVRPECFTIDPERGIAARVAVVEPTGSETHIFARLGEQGIVCTFRERIPARPGETIPIAIDSRRIHLFDPATTLRLQ